MEVNSEWYRKHDSNSALTDFVWFKQTSKSFGSNFCQDLFFFVKKPIFTTNFLQYINFWCNYVIGTCFKQHPSSVLILQTKILKETRNGSFRIDISWFKAGGCIFTTYGRLFKQAVACFKRESACFGFVKIWDKQFCPNQPQ